jgi:hypothetical protein
MVGTSALYVKKKKKKKKMSMKNPQKMKIKITEITRYTPNSRACMAAN